MSQSYGCTRQFGCTTYSNSGHSSADEAVLSVYQRAFNNGDWHPPLLREKWWQFWRPKNYDEETKLFLRANPEEAG